MREGRRTWGVVLAAALVGCGPPPVTPAGGAFGTTVADAGSAEGVAAAADAAEPAEETAGESPAVESPAAAAFRGVLAALASGSARAVRALVPSGGLLVLRGHVCRKPLYGVGTCRDEEIRAERRRVTDEVLGPWQDLVRRAGEADPSFSPETAVVDGPVGEGGRYECSAVLRLGADACRGGHEATISAVLREEGGGWILLELGRAEEILLCD